MSDLVVEVLIFYTDTSFRSGGRDSVEEIILLQEVGQICLINDTLDGQNSHQILQGKLNTHIKSDKFFLQGGVLAHSPRTEL